MSYTPPLVSEAKSLVSKATTIPEILISKIQIP